MTPENPKYLNNNTILCVSPTSWFSLWRNRQQIMSRLAKSNKVFFIEPQRNVEFSYVTDFKRKFKNIFKLSFERLSENLVILHSPPSLPLFGNLFSLKISNKIAKIMQKINNWFFAKYLKKVIGYFGISNPIFFIYNPLQYDISKNFDKTLTCYYVYDELSQYPQNTWMREALNRYDCLMTQEADIVFASSNYQFQKRKHLNSNAHWIPNAADFDHFNKALSANLEIPADIKEIKHPIIGYIGFLGFQLDINLLIQIGKVHPEWSLVLVGPDKFIKEDNYYILKKLNNVIFLGFKDVELLPSYLKAFDVAIMPYDKNTHMISSYPLKLHEYLAAGKPVVSTAIDDIRMFSDVVSIAETSSEFIYLLENALKECSSAGAIQRRIAVARNNTWDRRIEEISRLILLKLTAVG